MFGDWEPEDSWDASDPTSVLIVNLRARLALLGEIHRGDDPDRDDLDEVAFEASYWQNRRGTLDTRADLRLDQILDDIAFLRRRF